VVRAVFVDCTTELYDLIQARDLSVPAAITIHVGDPGVTELTQLAAGTDILLVEHTVVPACVFDACPSIRAVVFMGTGAGTYIDLVDAQRRGLQVLTTPGYGDRAVAEHALALMFAAARNVAQMDSEIRSGAWVPRNGVQLFAKKVAVIGLGGIGRCFADAAAAFGMHVAAWNRTPKPHAAFVPNLDEALTDATVVSLHLGLNAETAGILDERRLALPAPGYILVNTARAQLVDDESLRQGLASGRIGHAALDVFPAEPLDAASPYVGLRNTTLTAHAAYRTQAAYEELWLRTLRAFDTLCARG
jgi:D-3-phosphoglycerate dehydrogenase / 2-oxoglutarate reductase